jgi:hypothetical protein
LFDAHEPILLDQTVKKFITDVTREVYDFRPRRRLLPKDRQWLAVEDAKPSHPIFNRSALLMSQWPDTRILDLLGIELPIIQAPMAGATGSAMVIEASNAGGLGSMPAAMLSVEQLREELTIIGQHSQRPFNVNFFCHQPPVADELRAQQWKQLLEPYYRELGVDFEAPTPVSNRALRRCRVCGGRGISPESGELSLRPAGKIPARTGQGHRRQGAVVGDHGR